MGSNKNKTTRQNGNRKIVGAIKKHLTEAVTLEGVKYTPAKLAKMFQNGIDIADATDAASKIWHVAVAKERETTEQLAGVQTSLRNQVSATFGEAGTVFADFGFAPKTVRVVDTATKAKAVEKRTATRVARHTVGKRKKLEVTGATASEATTPAAVAAPVAPAAAEDPSSPSVSALPATTSQASVAPAVVKAVTGP